jgi:diguanylate cyclase (GGDEF)-like protein/PAS domain S-box-containing protein
MNNKVCHALIVDASPDDAEQLIAALRAGARVLKTALVAGGQEALSAARKTEWDLVFIDPSAAGMPLADFLHALRAGLPYASPVVTVHGAGTTDIAQYMNDGARDVVVKGDWGRLLPLIARELETSGERRELAMLRARLEKSEARYHAVMQNSQEAVCYCHDGMYVDANASFLSLLGCPDLESLKLIPALDMIDKADRARFKSLLQAGDGEALEFTLTRHDGGTLPAEVAASPIDIAGERCLQLVVRDISRRKALEKKLETLSQRDALTGLANRRRFAQELTGCLEKARAGGDSCKLLTLELLRLRTLNDTLGQATADRVLLKLSRVLQQAAAANHLVGRLGGGQFAVLLRSGTRDEAEALAGRLRSAAGALNVAHQGRPYELEFALGIEEVAASVRDVNRFLTDCYKDALDRTRGAPAKDEAMAPAAAIPRDEPAPAAGRGTQTPAEPAVRDEPVRAAAAEAPPEPAPATAAKEPAAAERWKADIERGLATHRFQLRFQPIVNIHGEPRELFQVVLALEDEHGALVAAREFMPAAGELGLAPKIDRWVAMHTIEALVGAGRVRRRPVFLMPLSPAAISDNVLLAALQQHLKATGAPAAQLCFAVDAASLARDARAALLFAQVVKRLGAGLVIDNYLPDMLTPEIMKALGAGYCLRAGGDIATLQKTVKQARAAGCQVIAKDVDDAELFAALWSQNVDYVAGDHLCPPMAEPEYPFAEEQELSSDTASAPAWSAGS